MSISHNYRSFLLYSVVIIFQAESRVTDLEYVSMPKLFHLDDFDDCMALDKKALYCSVTTKLGPEGARNKSDTWRIIQDVINDPRNYRHDLLRHGICIPTFCPKIDTIPNENSILKEKISECYTSKYQSLGLKSVVTDAHCETNVPHHPIDEYDIAVAIAIGVIIWIVIFATFYEGLARYKPKDEYDIIMNTRAGRVIACFSIPKNWHRLRSESTSPGAQALQCLQGIRFYNTQLVIMAHVAMVAIAGSVLNPTFSETLTRKNENVLFINGSVAIQTFFLIAGFLMAFNFLVVFEKRKKFELGFILKAFINRYVRLTPCLIVMMALNGTWLYHIARGPLWDRLVGIEYRNCRKNWWANLLYIHNYYDREHMCMQHTWYLATDTQLFLLSLIVISFMWIFQKCIKLILGISVAIGVLLPIIVNYYNDYDIVVRQYPEAFYAFFLNIPQWHMMYASSLTNFGGYALGLTFGYLFYIRRGAKFFTKKIYVVIWWIVVWGLPLGVIFYGVFIYQDDYHYTRIGAAIYVSVHKNLFALGICVLVYGATEGVGWFLRDCLYWSPLQVLGRLTYCTYLVHVAVMRVRGGQSRVSTYMSMYTLIAQIIGDAALSYMLATLLALFVEMPVSALQKLMVRKSVNKQCIETLSETLENLSTEAKDSNEVFK